MTAIPALSRRDLLKAGGALVVSFSLEAAWPVRAQTAATLKTDLGKTVDASEVDGFLAVHSDGSVTVFSGKVDLGTGLRIAMRQMVAEELDISVDRIVLVEGDTALTPDQGPTAGSTGIQRRGLNQYFPPELMSGRVRDCWALGILWRRRHKNLFPR